MMEFDEWCDLYSDKIWDELLNNGIAQELNFNFERELEHRYEKYLEENE